MWKRLKTLNDCWRGWRLQRRVFREARKHYVRIMGEHIGTRMAAQLIAKGVVEKPFWKLEDMN